MGVFVRRAAEELIKSTMCVGEVPSGNYEQYTRPERPGMTILTNHGRENERCNGRKLPTNDLIRRVKAKLILVMALQP